MEIVTWWESDGAGIMYGKAVQIFNNIVCIAAMQISPVLYVKTILVTQITKNGVIMVTGP